MVQEMEKSSIPPECFGIRGSFIETGNEGKFGFWYCAGEMWARGVCAVYRYIPHGFEKKIA